MDTDNVEVTQSKAEINGGFFYIKRGQKIEIAKSVFKDIIALQSGSFMYSESTMLQLKVSGSS
jgi:hypothetical protein